MKEISRYKAIMVLNEKTMLLEEKEEERDIQELVEMAKYYNDCPWRYNYLKVKDKNIEMTKNDIDIDFKIRRLGNQDIKMFYNPVIVDSEKQPFYNISGVCSTIATLFMVDKVLYVIERKNIIKHNREYLEKVIDNIEKKDIKRFVSCEDDLSRDDIKGVDENGGIRV